jgi:hypothetical protein
MSTVALAADLFPAPCASHRGAVRRRDGRAFRPSGRLVRASACPVAHGGKNPIIPRSPPPQSEAHISRGERARGRLRDSYTMNWNRLGRQLKSALADVHILLDYPAIRPSARDPASTRSLRQRIRINGGNRQHHRGAFPPSLFPTTRGSTAPLGDRGCEPTSPAAAHRSSRK